MAQIPFDAVLFDLDGVLTSTSALHAACWKRVFEEALGEPFDAERDYLTYVDGKPRDDGIRDFLRSRGVDPDAETVRRIGARKQALVERSLAGGVEPYEGSVRWVEQLRRRGVRTAVVSSSANCRAVLCAAGIAHLFELTVDGSDVERLGLRGKPAPDGFLEAAGAHACRPAACGRGRGRSRPAWPRDARGGFGIVVGVARGVGRRSCGQPVPTSWSATSGSWRNDAPARRTGRSWSTGSRPARPSRCSRSATATSACAAPPGGGCEPGARPGRDPQRLPRDVADRLPPRTPTGWRVTGQTIGRRSTAPRASWSSSELVTHAPEQTPGDPRRGNGFAAKVLVSLAARAGGARAVLRLATRNSGLELACGIDHHVEGGAFRATAEGDAASASSRRSSRPASRCGSGKYLAYHWARATAAGDLVARVDRTLDRAASAGYAAIEGAHRRHVEDFWRRSDVEVEGAPRCSGRCASTCSS